MRLFVRSFAFQVALGLATVVIAVASNQLLTDDGWNWWWTTGTLLAVLVLAAMTALANYLTAAPEVPAAVPAFVPVLDDAHGVPRPSAHFVGRSEDLGWLHDTLSRPGTVAVLHGLGGIGKTAVAAQYAHEAADAHRQVLWVSAETHTTLNEGLATAAARLGVVTSRGMTVAEGVEAILRWFDRNHNWILVLDNIPDMSTAAPVLRHVAHGRVIVTTRHAGTWDNAAARVVTELGDNDALQLLRSTADAPESWDGAKDLLRELGSLPIAIVQAGAYLRQQALSPTAYLDRLRNAPARMLAGRSVDTPQERTVARIWQVTLDTITASTPLAADVLRVLAWLAADGTPRSLLTPLPVIMKGRWLRWSRRRHSAALSMLDEALGVLHAYSMIRLTTTTISTHRLVQLAARTPDRSSRQRRRWAIRRSRQWSQAVLKAALTDVDNPANWPAWRELLPSVDAYVDATRPPADTPTFAPVLDRAADFLIGQSLTEWATSPYTDTPDISDVLDRAATFLQQQGLLDRSISMYRRALSLRTRWLGRRNDATWASRHNLAGAYRAAGRFDEAIKLRRRNVKVMAWRWFWGRRDLLAARSSLANDYLAAGRLDKAIKLQERNVIHLTKYAGSLHAATLAEWNALAYAYWKAGRLDEAINLHEQTLAARAQVLGADDADTVVSRGNLANAYVDAGRLDEAITLHEQTVDASVRLSGADHPETLVFQSNLAYAYVADGRLDEAIALFEATLASSMRIRAEQHRETLALRHNLASAYQKAGRLGEAVDLYEQTLTARTRIWGDDHPDTLALRSSLATARWEAGQLDEAIELHEKALAASVRVLGDDHPETLNSRNDLAVAYAEAGREAEALAEATLNHSESVRVFGPRDTRTLDYANTEAYVRLRCGDRQGAIELLEASLALSVESLGPDHPVSVVIRDRLEQTLETGPEDATP